MVAKSKGGYHIGNLDSSIETYEVITHSNLHKYVFVVFQSILILMVVIGTLMIGLVWFGLEVNDRSVIEVHNTGFLKRDGCCLGSGSNCTNILIVLVLNCFVECQTCYCEGSISELFHLDFG